MFAYIINGFPTRIGLPVALFSTLISGLFGQTADAAVYDVTTPQEFQTALSQSAANGDNDTINLVVRDSAAAGQSEGGIEGVIDELVTTERVTAVIGPVDGVNADAAAQREFNRRTPPYLNLAGIP